MLGKFFESFYNKIFVNIIVSRSKTLVYIETVSKKSVVARVEDSFDTVTLSTQMKDFIVENIAESPYYYISILDTSISQGAIPTCQKNEFSLFKDISDSEKICIDKSWTTYTSKENLYQLEKNYEKIGLDFVFSPFVILNRFFIDKIDTKMAMFILIEDNFITLSIYDKSTLIYTKHLDLEHHKDSDELSIYEDDTDELNTEEESIELDDIDAVDEVDLFDDFGDIEDLDTIEDIDEFSESKDLEEEFHESVEEEIVEKEPDGFNEDYQRFGLIQGSINQFYRDEKYDSEFIENAYIADSTGSTYDLKRYLEEEMFLSVYIRQIDLATVVCEVAKEELKR